MLGEREYPGISRIAGYRVSGDTIPGNLKHHCGTGHIIHGILGQVQLSVGLLNLKTQLMVISPVPKCIIGMHIHTR
jgi:hypothetical protein